jgi:hypothetical protein
MAIVIAIVLAAPIAIERLRCPATRTGARIPGPVAPDSVVFDGEVTPGGFSLDGAATEDVPSAIASVVIASIARIKSSARCTRLAGAFASNRWIKRSTSTGTSPVSGAIDGTGT